MEPLEIPEHILVDLDREIEAEILREDQAELDAIFAYWSDEHDNTRHDVMIAYCAGSIDYETARRDLLSVGLFEHEIKGLLT